MKQVNIGEAKRRWEALVLAVESGSEPGFVLCKRGKPQALLVPLEPQTVSHEQL